MQQTCNKTVHNFTLHETSCEVSWELSSAMLLIHAVKKIFRRWPQRKWTVEIIFIVCPIGACWRKFLQHLLSVSLIDRGKFIITVFHAVGRYYYSMRWFIAWFIACGFSHLKINLKFISSLVFSLCFAWTHKRIQIINCLITPERLEQAFSKLLGG